MNLLLNLLDHCVVGPTMFRNTGAWFSRCKTWRYTLWRIWAGEDSERRMLNVVMLNPSTADEIDNDPTVERCERRARTMGFDGLLVTNIFAFRATDPKVMRAAPDPVGQENNFAISQAASVSEMVICAWGNHGKFNGRSAAVLRMLRHTCPEKLRAFKVSKAGEPVHPLYLPYDLQPVEF